MYYFKFGYFLWVLLAKTDALRWPRPQKLPRF
nr:MAG TPA: hypothetical protein [Caudoviricetes sp.]